MHSDDDSHLLVALLNKTEWRLGLGSLWIAEVTKDFLVNRSYYKRFKPELCYRSAQSSCHYKEKGQENNLILCQTYVPNLQTN